MSSKNSIHMLIYTLEVYLLPVDKIHSIYNNGMAMDYIQYDGTVPRHSTSYKGNNWTSLGHYMYAKIFHIFNIANNKTEKKNQKLIDPAAEKM